jgi:uncharacterized protein (DUF58 family)
VREILGCEPQGRGTDLAGALELAGSLAKKRAVMAVISDFEVGPRRTEALADLERAVRPLGVHHDVVALRIRDPHERELPNVGLVAVEDAETGEVIQLETRRKKVRERFAQVAAAHAREVETVLRRASVDTVDIDTSRSYVPVLLELFGRRDRRGR